MIKDLLLLLLYHQIVQQLCTTTLYSLFSLYVVHLLTVGS